MDDLEEQLSAEQTARSRGGGSNWHSPLKARGSGYNRAGPVSTGFLSSQGLMDSYKSRDENVSVMDSLILSYINKHYL